MTGILILYSNPKISKKHFRKLDTTNNIFRSYFARLFYLCNKNNDKSFIKKFKQKQTQL